MEDLKYYVFYKVYESGSSGDFTSPNYTRVLGFDTHYVVVYDNETIKIRKIGLSSGGYVTGFPLTLDNPGDYHVALDNKS